MSELRRAVGLAVRRTNVGEADRIITFIGSDGQKFAAVARGVRKIKSRMAGHVELFNIVELRLAGGRNLEVITSARLVRSFADLSRDYLTISYACLFAEMLERLVPERQPVRGVFELAEASLAGLLVQGADQLSELTFRLRLLAVLGYGPELHKCVICHRPLTDGEQYLNLDHGGLSHGTCRDGAVLSLGQAEVKLWRLILGTATADLRRIGGVEAAAVQSLTAAGRFYDQLFGRRFQAGGLLGANSI